MRHIARYVQCLALLIVLFGSTRAGSLLSPDGKMALLSYKDGQIRLLDLESEKVIRAYSGHVGFAIALAFSPDEKTFLSGGEDRTVMKFTPSELLCAP